jgi:UDP-N-acetylmuramate dehydrogenase
VSPVTAVQVAAALEAAGLRVERGVPSAGLTTYRCGGPLAVLVRLGSLAEATRLAGALDPSAPLLAIGRGSNLLVADAGFDGVAVVLDREFERLELAAGLPGGPAGTEVTDVTAGAAVALPVLARRAAAAGIGGLEFYVGIPGAVGGAVRMNAGGHGRDTAEVLLSARCFDLATGTAADRPVADLGLGYRHSGLSRSELVLAARFAGRPDDPDACTRRISEIVQWRREHQPGGSNAGSVFRNPPGDAAGRLIEASGCKGLRLGRAVVSEKHANFFVADDGARATDVHDLVAEVQRRVEEHTGVRLEPELHLVGFASAPDGDGHEASAR